ncbi:reticulon-2 isoform X3 [Dendrobates tinctorius]|uniref:reticulon-2 isoform X3 n=1 Tax=Dendrobates tinctorius TaxID=92724 RepID=UPI003CC93F7A
MSEGTKSQASVSQQPACTSEDSGVRRSTRSRSNVAPTPPRFAETQRSRKASNMEEKPASSVQDGGPSGGKLSAHGGKADLAEESCGLQKSKESVSTYASRVMSHLREYEEASKTIRRLREEMRCTSAKAAGSSRPVKTQLQAEVNQLKLDINELEVRKVFLREKSGPFKEKLINEDRFREMADNREQRQMGLQPESQVDDDDDDDQQKAAPGSLQSHPQASCSELHAGQVTLASGRSSAGSGEDSDNSGQGGALMTEIKLLESSVCLQNFHLGDDLPEAAPGDQKKKAKKNKPKLQEVRPSGWEEAFGGSICLSWKKRT